MEEQPKDRKVYQEVKFSEYILIDLAEKSNTMFQNLRKGVILEKRTQVFFLWLQESYQFRKLDLVPKIYVSENYAW